MKCKYIINVMERLAPKKLAESWDNPGLLVGSPEQDVNRALVCLDVSEQVVDRAIELDCQLIISHHPVIFSGIKKLRTDTYQGRMLQKLLTNNIAVFSAHTNLDAAVGGVNDVLAGLIGLERIRVFDADHDKPLEETIGRIGYLSEPMDIEAFARQVKAGLKLDYVRLVKAGRFSSQGNFDKEATAVMESSGMTLENKVGWVKKVAVCSGAGAEFISQAAFLGADAYVTGDVKYHDAQRAVELGLHVVDGGHFGTEFPVTRVLMEHLQQELAQSFAKYGVVEFFQDDVSTDFFQII